MRELEATPERLYRRLDGMREFGLVFADAARERENASWGAPDHHLRTAIARVDDRVAEMIEEAPHPFWQAVREAVEASDED